MWRCCVIVSFHSSFASFGLEKKRAKNEPRSGYVFRAPGVRKRDGRSIYAGHLVSAFLGSQKRARIGDRKCCSLTKQIKTVSIAHIKKHPTLSYQTCDCLKTANIPANSSFLRCVAACVCDDVRMSLWHLQANDSAGQLGLRLHVGWTRR